MDLFDDISMIDDVRARRRQDGFDPAAGQMRIPVEPPDEDVRDFSDSIRLAQARRSTAWPPSQTDVPGGMWVPPDILDEWRKTFIDGMMGARRFYRESIGSFGGGGDDDEGCREEWKKSQEECAEAFANGWPQPQGRFVRGPLRPSRHRGKWTVNDCKPGLISERCGGNQIDYGPYEKPPRK